MNKREDGMTYYAALDVSLKFTAVCIMDSTGAIKYEAMVPTNQS